MIAKASAITGTATIAASAITLVRNRIIATLQGTEGIGIIGQFTSLQSLLMLLAGFGLTTGVIKYLSQYLISKEYDRISRSFSSALFIVLCCSAITSVALILFSNQISLILMGDDSVQIYVVIIAASIPMGALSSLYNSLINGARDIKSLARVSVYSSLGALIVAVPAVYFLGMVGVVVQIAAASAVSFVLTYAMSRRIARNWPISLESPRFDIIESKLLLRYGIVILITTMLLPATLLVTQTAIIHQEGLAANGLFTAAWALFWIYIGFATGSIAVYMMPTMSATRKQEELSMQMNNGVRFLAVVTTPLACIILLFPRTILTILYSPDFADASWLLQVMVIAGAFRVISFPIANMFVAKGHLKEYLPIESSWFVVFGGIVIILLPTRGLDAIAYAVLAAYIVHATLFALFANRILGLGYTKKVWSILAISAALLTLVLVLTQVAPIVSYVMTATCIPFWFFYTTEKEERRWLLSKFTSR